MFNAATTTEAAMHDSTSRDGRLTTDNAASDSVIEWANVKAVTTFSTSNGYWCR